MRLKGIGLVMFLCAILYGASAITPLQVIGPDQSKIAAPGPHEFCVWQDLVYMVDNAGGGVKVWSVAKNRVLKSELIKLPAKTLITDICRDDKLIYLLDSKNSRIMIYDKDGALFREIRTKSVPACSFKNATRILVNYQSMIYVLDQGRGAILRFTPEGLYTGQVSIPGAYSFTIGPDQLLRVLFMDQKRFYVMLVGQDLDLINKFEIYDLRSDKDDIADFSINDHGQIYFINSKRTQIGKLSPDLKLINKSYFGSKNKTSNKNSFFEPVQIRVQNLGGVDHVYVLDTSHNAVKIFTENDLAGLTKLQRPLYRMRPELANTKQSPLLDLAFGDSLSYQLTDGVMPNRKGSRQITCFNQSGQRVFSIFSASFKSDGVRSFDAITVYKNRLFILDKLATRVHIFNALEGSYEDSFGEKGKHDGAMNSPGSIVADPKGNIYVADTENSRISIWKEYGAFSDNIDLRKDKLKPRLLRSDNYFLYVLANKGEIYKFRHDDVQRDRITIASLPNISTFDILDDSRIALVKSDLQELVILSIDKGKPARSSAGRTCFGYKVDSRFFASSPTAEFPFFSDIFQIRYDKKDMTLYISDAKVNTARILKFIAPPLIPKYLALDVNSKLQTVLMWDQGDGIKRWSLQSYSEAGDTLTLMTSEPAYTVQKPQDKLRYYRVAAYSDDNKLGPYTDAKPDHFSLARYLYETQNYPEAIRTLETMLDENFNARASDELFRNLYDLSDYYAKAGEYEKALLTLKKAGEFKGVSSEMVSRTVLIYKLMGAYKAGVAYLDKLENAKSPQWSKERISLYNLDKDYVNVIREAELYLRSYGDDADILSFLASANEARGQYQAALDATRRIVVLNQNFADQLKIGELLYKLNQYDEAIPHLSRLLTLYVDERDLVYFLIGKCHYGKGDWGLAADNLENALTLNKESAEYHLNLAMAYEKGRKPKEALDHYRESWRVNPKDFSTGINYAQFLQRNELGQEALAVIDQLMIFATDDEKDGQFHIFYGDLLTQNGRYDEAVTELAIAVEQFPDDYTLYNRYEQSLSIRERENRFRNPLEIKELKFDTLYPSMQQYYRDHPIGTITIYNTRNTIINNVKVTVIIEDITDGWIDFEIQRVQPNQRLVKDIFAPINQNIYRVSGEAGRDLNAEARVEYQYEGDRKSHKEVRRLQVASLQAIDWSNRKQLGCFVNPADVNLRTFVVGVLLPSFDGIELPKTSRNLIYAAQIYDFYHANDIKYVSDPSSSNISGVSNDYIQFPFQTLDIKRGDCDDLLVLLAASFGSVGVETGFIDIPGHVILVVDSGLNSAQIMQSGFDVNHFIYRNDKYWIPIETTLLGKNNFVDSWINAIERYRDLYTREQVLPDLIEFSQSQKIYPPAMHTGLIASANFNRNQQARDLFSKDINDIMLLNQITVEKEFIQTTKAFPNNLDVKLQYALWSVDHGKMQQAENLLEQILAKAPANFAALVNLGNVYAEKAEYEKARIKYTEALKTGIETDMVHLNLCVTEYRAGYLNKAKEYFAKIKDQDIFYKIGPKMYADLLGKGD